jgi:hypothetical protein
MLQYLAIIEKKTNEILQMYYFSQNKVSILKNNKEKGQVGAEAGIRNFRNDDSMFSASTIHKEKDPENLIALEELIGKGRSR